MHKLKTEISTLPNFRIPAMFLCLTENHKDNVPVRPIVSSDGSVTYDMAKFLAFVLRPLVGNTKNNVQNSLDFV